jgi:N-acyl homoserine lactone hydrolase
MRVERFIVGAFSAGAGLFRSGDDRERIVRFPIPTYVIETAEERILVDTGVHPDAAEDATRRYGDSDAARVFTFELEQRIDELVDLSTITKVVFTHLHFDHAGAATLVPPNVPVVVQRREWEAAHDAASIAKNFYQPIDYAKLDGQVVLVDGDHDLLGDGTIELLLTPGHTLGHQSVRVGEQLVIGGDVAHFASTLDDHRFPVFADDHDAQAESAERLRGFRDAGAAVTPGHDADVLRPGPVPV